MPDSRTLKLTGDEMAALVDALPNGEDVREMTPLRDGIDKLAAKKRELEARKKKHYYSCRPDYGPREKQYREVLRTLTGLTVDGPDVCCGPQIWFSAVNKNRTEQFEEKILQPAREALARGSSEKRNF